MTDAMKAALREATRTACCCDCDPLQPGCLALVAEEIAAFLRACPVMGDLPPGADKMCFVDERARENWAAAVEAAAREVWK